MENAINGSAPRAAVPQENQTSAGYSFYQKIWFLYFLNLVDWICTEVLLASGHFSEANPIMRPVLGSFLPTLLIKGALPLGLIVLCIFVYRAAGIGYSRLADVLLNIGIIMYALVNLWHILNFVLLFSMF